LFSNPILSDKEAEENEESDINSLTLAEQRAENVARISAKDLKILLGLKTHNTGESDHSSGCHYVNERSKVPVLVVDVRPLEEYRLGALPGSLHLPNSSWESSEDEEALAKPELRPAIKDALALARKGKIVCVAGKETDCSDASVAAERLLAMGYSRLCVLHRGLGVFKAVAGGLVVPDS